MTQLRGGEEEEELFNSWILLCRQPHGFTSKDEEEEVCNQFKCTRAVTPSFFLARCTGDQVTAATVGSTPGQGRVNDRFILQGSLFQHPISKGRGLEGVCVWVGWGGGGCCKPILSLGPLVLPSKKAKKRSGRSAELRTYDERLYVT